MEKKEYQKPQINVIAIDTEGMIATSSTQYIQAGKAEDISSDDVDEDGFFKVD